MSNKKPIDIAAAARGWLREWEDTMQSHNDECHEYHPRCLVARLADEIDRLRESRETLSCAAVHHLPGEYHNAGERCPALDRLAIGRGATHGNVFYR